MPEFNLMAELQFLAVGWIVSAVAGMTLAGIILAIIVASYWAALFLTSRIVPVVDEEGYPQEGRAALRHTHYRFKVWLGHVSFFPYMSDHRWIRPLRFHFILITLLGFIETTGIWVNEAERPMHLSLLALFLPSLLMHTAGILPRQGSAHVGMAKRRGPGPITARRCFTDEEIEERKAAERRQREATQRFWEL